MGTNASIGINEFSAVVQSVNTTMSTAFSDFVHSMEHIGEHVRSGAMSEAQAMRNTAEFLASQYQAMEAAAQSAAQKAISAGNSSAAEFWQQRAQSLAITAAERSVLGDAAWIRGGAALDVVDSLKGLGGALAHAAGVAGFLIEAGQMLEAAARGDWDRVGEVSTGMLGAASFGYVGLAIAAAMIAPVTAAGVVTVGILGGVAAVIGHSLGVKAWNGVNTSYLSARSFIQRSDPLTLDLDADGLETVGINTTTPILFDHNADGVKTATGWVKSDDAFLVFDRNNNGLIDNGRELFGDSTQLYAGGLAADGFAALAQEDTNADGLVNAADANWTKLKLWRDLNQDGISQSNELLTLASQNITALKVAKTANSQTLGNGNQIADLGGFIRGDGSEGTLGEVTGSMGDINLADNPFYSQFTDSIPLTEAAQGIAEMQGSGRVRSLRQAASLDGNTLVTQVNALAGQSRAQMLQSLDTLLADWSATSDFVTSGAAAQGYGYSLKYLPAGTGTADALAAYGLNGSGERMGFSRGRTANDEVWRNAA